MDIQKDKDFTSLPEIAKLYQACKERDLTIAEREYLKGARDAWQAATAQAVPEVINVGNELQSWVAVWSFKARHDREDYIVVDANLLAEKIEKLTGANA